MEFELVAWDVPSLRELCESFKPVSKKKSNKGSAEFELFETLGALLSELEKRETSFSKLMHKAKVKMMQEYYAPERQPEVMIDSPKPSPGMKFLI